MSISNKDMSHAGKVQNAIYILSIVHSGSRVGHSEQLQSTGLKTSRCSCSVECFKYQRINTTSEVFTQRKRKKAPYFGNIFRNEVVHY